ncbi:MAG: 23S rRNA (uridine(2552)-2'-O)-methyltransferase [Candidatus Bathyarchaeota archaeon]|nr:MAG: 23S rRNA (uridine(2552)-2'-O)-methyltransferase [Candidatus Bathyarchaeota archaeon]
MSKRWRSERGKDYYYRLSKKEGYRSRAAYKLIQISKKYRLLKAGDHVVDFGAAPGGWMQVARKIVGDKGYVLGIDPTQIEKFPWHNVEVKIGNVKDYSDMIHKIKLPKKKVDVVLSDVSPNISGIRDIDHVKQIELAEDSLKAASFILRPGGNFVVKAFQGDLLKPFVNNVKKFFKYVRLIKPAASKSKSSEIYVLGLGFNPPTNEVT